jgi:hypothetical protein
MKKNGGDEAVRVIIHIYMEMSEENSVAILNKQKCYFFSFFSENKSTEQILLGMGVYQWDR